MSVLPIPDLIKNNIYEITPEIFLRRGVKFVFLDVDNTIAPYTVSLASPEMIAWVQRLKDAGLELFILSNNRGNRPAYFSGALDLPYRKKAWKPFTKIAKEVLREKGYSALETAFIGDQIYTDACCAKWCGAYCVLVHPIQFHKFILRFRYWLEAPFRLAYLLRGAKK